MKKVIRIIAFSIVFILLFEVANDILIVKSTNRYYMLRQELKEQKAYDVQVFGSCHAYSSFNPIVLEEEYGISAYNMSNPSEIMPATYLRVLEQLKKNKPKVVLVETWGINAYETYISSDDIMQSAFPFNIGDIPVSKEKLEVINDFETLDFWEDNFAIFKYRSRIFDSSLSEIDFHYSFDKTKELYGEETDGWICVEMENRFKHDGFLAKSSIPREDYEERQNEVAEDDVLSIEPDIMKYVDKIIEICDSYDVKLIFYRTPYISTENELRKVNYLEQYLEQRGVDFYDMEKEINYNYSEDFNDYEHLSEIGARKTTEYLGEKIIEVLK